MPHSWYEVTGSPATTGYASPTSRLTASSPALPHHARRSSRHAEITDVSPKYRGSHEPPCTPITVVDSRLSATMPAAVHVTARRAPGHLARPTPSAQVIAMYGANWRSFARRLAMCEEYPITMVATGGKTSRSTAMDATANVPSAATSRRRQARPVSYTHLRAH